jgi:hypothetical protein
LPFESLQTNVVYFAEIFEVQLKGEWPGRCRNFAHATFF